MRIFIPFVDGILNYDCKKCGYCCCRSGVIVMNNKEKISLLQKYPFLRHFFIKQTKKIYALRKYLNCWFLAKNGACYIQKKYGNSYKPLLCRSHPFYIARCNGEYIVNIRRCPMLYAGKKNENSSHKLILMNAQEAIINNLISEEIHWSRKRLNLEKKIFKNSEMFLGNSNYLDFAAYQMSVAKDSEKMMDIKSELTKSVELWKSFLEIDKLNMDNKILTYELTAITSLLRVKSPYLRYMDENKIPLLLLALYFYMLLFFKGRKIKTYIETYEEILNDISLGLFYLKKEDLYIKRRRIEDNISYLRKLSDLHIQDLMPKTENNIIRQSR